MIKKNLFWSLCYIISMFFPLENIEIHESYVHTYIWQMNIYLKIMCYNILDSVYSFTSRALKSFASVLLDNFFTTVILIFHSFYFFPIICAISAYQHTSLMLLFQVYMVSFTFSQTSTGGTANAKTCQILLVKVVKRYENK